MYNAAHSQQKRFLVIPNAEHDTTYQTAPQLHESTVKRFLEDAFQRPGSPGELGNRNDPALTK
jgi:hypothetical protein